MVGNHERSTIMMKTASKLAFAILAVIVSASSSASAITLYEWDESKNEKISFVYKGAHAPYGYNGTIEEHYFWTQGYGPAGSVGSPKVYDINTGELLLDYLYDCSIGFIGQYYFITRLRSDSDQNEITQVYKGSQLLLELNNTPVYIDDSMWHVLKGDELVSYSRGGNILVNRIKIPKKSEWIYGVDDGKDYICYYTLPETKNVIKVNLKTLEQSTVLRNSLKERVINTGKHNENLVYDYNMGIVTNKTNNLSYKIMEPFDYQCDMGRFYLDYASTKGILKCIDISTMEELWKKECFISSACVYKDKLFCYFEGKTNPKQACIDIKTGNILWSESSFLPSYYDSVFVGDTAYDNANGRFVKLDLQTGKDLMSVPRNRVTAIDFKRDRYYTYEPDWTPHCYELSTHKKIW